MDKEIMKQLQMITKEINELTLLIEQEYPELYQHLDENPMTISNGDDPHVDLKSFTDYRDGLKELLKQYSVYHPK